MKRREACELGTTDQYRTITVDDSVHMNAKKLLRFSTLIVALSGPCIEAQTLPAEIPVNPRAAYVLVNNDPADNTAPIDLGFFGIAPGHILRLTALGDFNYGPGYFSDAMTAVFSSNSVLLAKSLPNRVPGAIAAGTPIPTGPTYFGNLANDIPEDFLIQTGLQPPPPFSTTNISVRVPQGAAFLFVAASDSLFYDTSVRLKTPANRADCEGQA